MTPAAEAVAWAVGALALFGVIMMTLDVAASRGAIWLRPWVEERAPIVYGLTISLVAVVLVAGGRITGEMIWGFESASRLLASFALAPVCALGMYFTELYLASRSGLRPGGMLSMPSAQEAVETLTSQTGVWWTLATVSAVVEELLFRGLVLSALAPAVGTGSALAVSAVLFGLHHVTFGVVSIVSKTLGGLLFGALVLLGGSVLPAILAHMCFQYFVWRRLTRKRVLVCAN